MQNKKCLLLTALTVFSLSVCGSITTSTSQSAQVVKTSHEYSAEMKLASSTASGGEVKIDISDCKSFDDIINKKLTSNMGYAKVKIGDVNALLVTNRCYDYNGPYAPASTIFTIKNGAVQEIARVDSGSTAYPLSIKNGLLYCADSHSIFVYTIKDNKLVTVEENWSDNVGKYYHKSEGSSNAKEIDAVTFYDYYNAYYNADIIRYTVVK